jgi:hypothetical protein
METMKKSTIPQEEYAAMNAEIKAELLAIGKVDVEPSLLPRPSRSTAGRSRDCGPFSLDQDRVHLEITSDSPLRMVHKTGLLSSER